LLTAISGEDITILQDAIAHATELAVEEDLLQTAQKRCKELHMFNVAKNTDIGALRCVITEAQDAGVAKDSIAKARCRLAELEVLQETACGEREQLRQAIGIAVEAGVEASVLVEPHRRLAELDMIAIAKGDSIASLELAISVATQAGVEEDSFVQPRFRLAELKLTRAIQGEDEKALHEAIGCAEIFGISGTPLEAAVRRLTLLELRRATVEEDLEVLPQAIRIAKNRAVETKAIEAAMAKLDELDHDVFLELLCQEVEVAKEGTDIEALRHAIQSATNAGADDEVLQAAQVRLAELVLTHAMQFAVVPVKELQDDVLRTSIATVTDAIKFAKDVSYEGADLQDASDKLLVLEAEACMRDARARLEAAIQDDENMDELKKALKEATDAGVDQSLIEEAARHIT